MSFTLPVFYIGAISTLFGLFFVFLLVFLAYWVIKFIRELFF